MNAPPRRKTYHGHKDSDQPANLRSMIKLVTVRIYDNLQAENEDVCDCANTQVNLSLR